MKYVLWDWNGTLFDDLDICRETIDTLLKRHGIKPLVTIEKYRSVFCFPITEFYKNAGFDLAQISFELLAREYMEIYLPMSFDKTKCSLNKNALDVIKELDSRGFSQTIISASKTDILKRQINNFGIENMFDEIFGIGDIYAKSKADIARNWKEKYTPQPTDAVFIGDSLHDSEVSEIIGCRCLLYDGGHQKIPENDDKYEKITSLWEVTEKI